MITNAGEDCMSKARTRIKIYFQGRKSQCFDCCGCESLLAGGEETLAPPLSLHPVSPLLAALVFREVRSVAAACEVRVQQATAFVISCTVVYICVYIPVLS